MNLKAARSVSRCAGRPAGGCTHPATPQPVPCRRMPRHVPPDSPPRSARLDRIVLWADHKGALKDSPSHRGAPSDVAFHFPFP